MTSKSKEPLEKGEEVHSDESTLQESRPEPSPKFEGDPVLERPVEERNARKQWWASPSFVALMVTVLSAMISFWSAQQAKRSAEAAKTSVEIARALGKLDLRPKLFVGQKFDSSAGKEGFEVVNLGELDAVRIQIRFSVFAVHKSGSLMQAGSSELQESLSLLEPERVEFVELPLQIRHPDLGFFGSEPNHKKALELRATYRREQDGRVFNERKMFYLDPDGALVTERVIANNPEYRQVVKAARSSPDFFPNDSFWRSYEPLEPVSKAR